MARKKLTKRSQREWDETLKVSKNASEAEKEEAKAIYRELDKRFPLKRSQAFSLALHRIFSTKGNVLGSGAEAQWNENVR